MLILSPLRLRYKQLRETPLSSFSCMRAPKWRAALTNGAEAYRVELKLRGFRDELAHASPEGVDAESVEHAKRRGQLLQLHDLLADLCIDPAAAGSGAIHARWQEGLRHVLESEEWPPSRTLGGTEEHIVKVHEDYTLCFLRSGRHDLAAPLVVAAGVALILRACRRTAASLPLKDGHAVAAKPSGQNHCLSRGSLVLWSLGVGWLVTISLCCFVCARVCAFVFYSY